MNKTLLLPCALTFFLISTAMASASASDPLDINGEWVQGGMLTGRVTPGSTVTIFEQKAVVAKDGRFVFGLGRNVGPSVAIEVVSPNGETQVFEYDVRQRTYKTQKIEGVAKKYVAPPPEVSKRIKDEAGQVWRARRSTSDAAHYSSGFRWPMEGPITGVYGSQRIFNGVPKRPHYGLDIAGPTGTLVYAPAPGVVRLAHDDMYYSGGTLIVDHGQGISSTFIHLSEILVGKGATIKVGQAIAKVGATGRATGPHLDWRINWFAQRLDPFLVLPPRPGSVNQN